MGALEAAEIGALAISALSTAISGIGAGHRARKTARHNAQLQDYYNMKYWNLQNEYNSPTEQIKRLQAAGLNPALLYSSGSSAASGNAGDIGSVGVSDIGSQSDFSGIGTAGDMLVNGITRLQQIKESNKNIELRDADIALKNAQTQSTIADKLRIEASTKKLLWDVYRGRSMLGGELERLTLGNEKLRRQNTGLFWSNQYAPKLYDASLARAYSGVAKANADIAALNMKMQFMPVDMRLKIASTLSQMGVNNAKIKELNSNAYKLGVSARYIPLQFGLDVLNSNRNYGLNKGKAMWNAYMDLQDNELKRNRYWLDYDKFKYDKKDRDNQRMWRNINNIINGYSKISNSNNNNNVDDIMNILPFLIK